MNIAKTGADPSHVFLDVPVPAGTRVRMGLMRFRAGERVPVSGMSLHQGTETSYVLKGSLAVTAGGETLTANAGDLVSIPPGEGHYTQVLTDAAVVYLLVE